MGYQHSRVNHSQKVYVAGDVHNNTIEGSGHSRSAGSRASTTAFPRSTFRATWMSTTTGITTDTMAAGECSMRSSIGFRR